MSDMFLILRLSRTVYLGALGGTLNRDPCSLWGVLSGLLGYIRGIEGLYIGYIRYWD